MPITNEKKKYVTNEQKSALVDFVEINPKLIKCKFDSQFTYKDCNKLWEDLATNLNGMAGAKKNVKEWRKCWHDLRRNTKEKAAKVKRHMKGTGGGPILDEDFTDVQEKVMNLIGTTAVEGHSNVIESNVIIEIKDSECAPLLASDNIQNEESFILPYEFEKESVAGNIRPSIRKMKATARFEKSANAVEGLRSVAEQKLDIKKSYYERKIQLLERQVEAIEHQSHIQEEALHIWKIHFGLENCD